MTTIICQQNLKQELHKLEEFALNVEYTNDFLFFQNQEVLKFDILLVVKSVEIKNIKNIEKKKKQENKK